jgi:hypothetical protein
MARSTVSRFALTKSNASMCGQVRELRRKGKFA